MEDDKALYPPIDPFSAGLRGCCPRCGQGKLFDGLLKVRPACSNCGLDYSFADSGDGPVVFVLFIVGFLVVGAALWTDMREQSCFGVRCGAGQNAYFGAR